jgi:hypothetical protein
MSDVDQDTVAAGVIAAKQYAATITYMYINVGTKITDDEYKALVTAVINAVDTYRAAKTI